MPFPHSLTTDGIEGGSQVEGRQGSSDVFQVRHEMRAPRDLGTGMASGVRKYGVFYVTITTDKSIPLYAQAMSRNDTLSSVRLDMFRIKPDGRGQERFYSITLLNARVASMQAVIPKSDDPKNEDTTPMFIIGFVGEKIEWHHHPTNKVESDEWIPPSQGE